MRFVFIVITVFCLNTAYTQYLYHFSERDFYNQKYLVNPSYVGLTDGTVLNINARLLNQALFADSYNRAYVNTLSYSSVFGLEKMNGVGLLIKDYRLENSVESETGFYTMYSRKFNLQENLNVYPSVSFNVKHNYFDAAKLLNKNSNHYSDSNLKKIRVYSFLTSAGTIMSIKNINIGIAISNFFKSEMYWVSSKNDLPLWYNFFLEYSSHLKKNKTLHFFMNYQNNRYSNKFRIPGDESASFTSYISNKRWIIGGQFGLHTYYADNFWQIFLPKELGFNLGYRLNHFSEIMLSKKSYLLSNGVVLFSSSLSYINLYEISFKYAFIPERREKFN